MTNEELIQNINNTIIELTKELNKICDGDVDGSYESAFLYEDCMWLSKICDLQGRIDGLQIVLDLLNK